MGNKRLYSTPPSPEELPPQIEVVNAAITNPPTTEVSKAMESLDHFAQQTAEVAQKAAEVVPTSTQASWLDNFFLVEWLTWGLQAVHDVTGCPWWGTIILTTISIRVVLLPAAVKLARHTAKTAEHQPRMTELQTELMKAKNEGDQQKANLLSQEYSALLLKANPFKTLLFMSPQGLTFFVMFLSLRKMAENVPELHTEGILWFTDLAVADPYFRLPLLSMMGFLAAFELGADGQTVPESRKRVMRFIMFPMMLLMFWFTCGFPQILHLYWLTSSLFGMGQVFLFKQPKIQALLKIPPRPSLEELPQPQVQAPQIVYKTAVTLNPKTAVTLNQKTAVTLNPKKLSKKQNEKFVESK